MGAPERHQTVVPAGEQQAWQRSLRAAGRRQTRVADWRRRMASEPGKALYKERAKAECPNAWGRRMGLSRLLVRGKQKVRTVLLWFALAHNMLRAFALRRAAEVAAI